MTRTPSNTHRTTLLLSLLLAVSTLSSAQGGKEANGVPRVVVNILVDQLRSDYLEAFMPLYSEDGFKKLLNEGLVYSQAEYPLAHPDLASASASLATGTTPSNHGITGKQWIDRKTLRPVFCCDDKNYPGTGTTDASSPQHLGVTTIGDELKVASEGKALVYAIAPFREAAIFSAGHAANSALWLDNNTGYWVSSSYYGELPAWVNVHNQFHNLTEKIKSTTWEPVNSLTGNFSYFLSGGIKEPFSHKFKKETAYLDFKTSGLVNEEVAALATSCITNTMVGRDNITDYLSITFYAGNFRHQSASVAPIELQDIYMRLDRALAELLQLVEQKVGKDKALFVVTSTGHVDEESADLSTYRIPTGKFDMVRTASMLNIYLAAIYGPGQYVEATHGTQFYLNHKLIEERQISLTELLERSQDLLLQFSGVKDVYTSQRLLQGAWTPGISRIRGGYNAMTSGDIFLEIAPGWRYVNADTKENQLVRESYIPFPIVFYGHTISAAKIETPVTIDFIAPTLSKVMRIRAPNACSNAPLPLQ